MEASIPDRVTARANHPCGVRFCPRIEPSSRGKIRSSDCLSLHDRLAVTSGHCAGGADELVYSKNGVEIGRVVAWLEDVSDGHGKLVGARGYTVFSVYKRFSLEPYFTGLGTISEGDWVTKYGERSGKTRGRIAKVKYNSDRPDLSLVYSDMVQLPGDSGSLWVTSSRAAARPRNR